MAMYTYTRGVADISTHHWDSSMLSSVCRAMSRVKRNRVEYREPMVDPSNNRYALFPIQHQDLFDRYKAAVACFWTVEEVDLARDRSDFESLGAGEQEFIKVTLAFFAASDGIVMENLGTNFSEEIVLPEARQFLAFQAAMESVHSEMYSLLIDTLISDVGERTRLFRSVSEHPSISRKASWAKEWMDRSRPLSERLVAFACVEGIHFSASFACIYWFRRRGVMPGLCFSNELIARDEGMHRDFAVALVGLLDRPPDTDRITEIIKSAVEIERGFVRDALGVPIVGIDSVLMEQYVRFVADHLAMSFGCPAPYGVENPFPWMEMLSIDGKANFFERRVSDYRRHVVSTGGGRTDDAFSTVAYF